MSIKRLFDAVERRGDIGRRVAALVLLVFSMLSGGHILRRVIS
jgi:hypothetical protein